MNEVYHYADPYLLNPMHPVTVGLIGVGGTGSRMLTNLAMIDQSLRALNHPGLHVLAVDDDKVTESNIGRQQFSPADVGQYKSAILISRINRFYGTNWDYSIERMDKKARVTANITISCVDNKATRRLLSKEHKPVVSHHASQPLYWMDCGNGKNYGQVILSTYKSIKQPTGGMVTRLRNPDEILPGCLKGKDNNEPSCSLAQALRHQDLFINTSIAMYASQLLWKLLSHGRIDYQGVFVNMETLQVSRIKLTEESKTKD